jgi:hypothetical protein
MLSIIVNSVPKSVNCELLFVVVNNLVLTATLGNVPLLPETFLPLAE